MAIVRSLGDGYTLTDYTREILSIPNGWNLIGEMGLFQEDVLEVDNFQFENRLESQALIGATIDDLNKGDGNRQDNSNLHSVLIPKFIYTDSITSADTKRFRRRGTANSFESVAQVRAEKMIRIQRNWDITREYSRMQAIMGGVYAPNGDTNVSSWYTEFGVTRRETNHDLTNPAFDVLAAVEAEVAHIQDTVLTGGNIQGVVALCSPEYFQALISSDQFAEYFREYSTTNAAITEPLRMRQSRDGGANNSSSRFRSFVYQGVEFIEYRGTFADRNQVQQRIIPAGDAYYLPMGVPDMFKTYFAPADFLDTVNLPAQTMYMFEWNDGRGKQIQMHSESNFINMVDRPAAITRAFI